MSLQKKYNLIGSKLLRTQDVFKKLYSGIKNYTQLV